MEQDDNHFQHSLLKLRVSSTEFVFIRVKADDAQLGRTIEFEPSLGVGRQYGFHLIILFIVFLISLQVILKIFRHKKFQFRLSDGMCLMICAAVAIGVFTSAIQTSEEKRVIARSFPKKDEFAKTSTFKRDFCISKHEITNAQYAAVLNLPLPGEAESELPVQGISPLEAESFCKELSKLLGKKVRIPTEQEWEYAFRGSTRGVFGNSNSLTELRSIAWFNENSGGRVHPVGKKSENSNGICDLLGNVYEWCQGDSDRFRVEENERDGSVPSGYILKGGGYNSNFFECTYSRRIISCRINYQEVGIRVVLEP